MASDTRLLWLRRVLVFKAFFAISMGLLTLLGPLSLLEFLGLPIPADPIYLRLVGTAATGWGVAYWLARRDPIRNVAIVKAGIVDNALPTAAVVFLGLTGGVSSVLLWVSALITGLVFVSFLILMPREAEAVAT